jgi:menaquinone-specific isochorismate synthase
MPDSANHSSSGLPPDDRRLIQPDLYLRIATQIRHFFKYDAIELPLGIAGKILRVEFQIPTLEPLRWLSGQDADIKIYWSDRSGHFTMAGVGSLDTISGDAPISYPAIFDRLRQNLSDLFPQVRYYGGIGFSQDRSLAQPLETKLDPVWKLFGNYRFVVPKFEVWTDGIDTYFACNFRSDSCPNYPSELRDLAEPSIQQKTWQDRELDLILKELTQLDFSQIATSTHDDRSLPALPLLIDRTDSPNWIDWNQNINAALTNFAELNLDKIVLARQSTLTFTEDLHPQLLLLALQPHNPHSYHFCFQINPTAAFIGTSPERLYHRHDRVLSTEAIAGTRHRGASIQIDRELSDDLRNSPKDIREHQLVVENLQETLAKLCRSVTIDDRSSILKLNKVQHLYTKFHGILKSEFNDAEILPQLHPTPAVGGFPRDRALKLIRELEPFERGWYAAPVGWVGYDETEFAVAIRSGAIDRDRLLLFAGAGIVEGSQAEEEWAEVENKIRHFTDLFSLNSTARTSDGKS